MSSYARFLELLAAAPDIKKAFKEMLKGRDLKAAAEEVKQYMKTYGRLCSNPLRADSSFYDKTKPGLQFVAYYIFPAIHSPALCKVDNLIKLYNFFFVAEKVAVKYAYEDGYDENAAEKRAGV